MFGWGSVSTWDPGSHVPHIRVIYHTVVTWEYETLSDDNVFFGDGCWGDFGLEVHPEWN